MDEIREARLYHTLMQRHRDSVFVFGSNHAGIHGAGAARAAFMHYGARRGVATGRSGRSYAIPTKADDFSVLPLRTIRNAVAVFKHYAARNERTIFVVTRVGCGLAGYTDEEIAPLFIHSPPNCLLPERWQEIIGKVPAS